MFLAKTLSFYKRPEVQRALLEQARDKEVSVKFEGAYFGKRPDALFTEGDVFELAKRRASSFHCSEELWWNPLHVRTGMSRAELAELRKGWDLILDIDCPYWPLSKLITFLLVKAIEAHGVGSVSVKFSGNKGFHIAVPFEAFPERVNGQLTKDAFPEAPRRIAYYLLDYLARHYVKDKGDFLLFDRRYRVAKDRLALALGKSVQDLMVSSRTDSGGVVSVFDPLRVVEVDTILLAHRHLYRMPYSFHEKSSLVSVPVRKDRLLSFSKREAVPERVDFSVPFLDRSVVVPGEASRLLLAAYDFQPRLVGVDEGSVREDRSFEVPSVAIPEEFFPPCMQRILQGLRDGRKRSLFTLINFLRGVGWDFDRIESLLLVWNERNDEPLRPVVIKGRLRYERSKKVGRPPHNCQRYYQDFGVCHPDALCSRVKNPLQYAKRKFEAAGLGQKKRGGRPRLTEEQKEMRRRYRERKKQDSARSSPDTSSESSD